MAQNQQGKAGFFGAQGALQYSGVATINTEIQSAQIGQSADITELRNGMGKLIGTNVENEADTLSIDFIPVATTKAGAAAAAVLPAQMSKVVLSGFATAYYNGDWIYREGATIRHGAEYNVISVPLIRYKDPTQSATILTTVVS